MKHGEDTGYYWILRYSGFLFMLHFFHALLIREWLSLVEIKQFYSENVIIFGLDTVRNRFHPGCT